MADLEELAGRVEGLSGPDAEIDALIRCAFFASPGAYVKQSPINGAWCIYELGHNGRERSWEPRGLSREQRLGSFTASIDAAITLVPEGVKFEVDGGVRNARSRATIGAAWQPFWTTVLAVTPALALTAATLRARARTQGNPNG